MLLRRARPSDAYFLLRVEELCFDDLAFSFRALAYHVKNNIVVVCEIDEAIAGYYVLSPLTKKKQRRLYSIGVHPDFRGHHIGYLLMMDLEKRSRARTLILEVDETNDAAIRLYKKCGYEVFGRYDKYYGSTDALRMRKLIKK